MPVMNWKTRIVGHGNEDPNDLLANPRNWRIHPKAQQDALAGALDQVGWVQQVTVNRTTGHLVDGHLRVELALRREEPTVPVTYVELTPEEEGLVLASLDPIAAMAGQDDEKLRQLLAEVEFDSKALEEALEALAPEPRSGMTDPDDVPEVDETEVYVKPGDLWVLGGHRLMCGDSTDAAQVSRLMNGNRADLCFTSPPYALGSSVRLSGNKTMSKRGNSYELHKDDAETWDELMRQWFTTSHDAVTDAWVINVQPLAGNKRSLMRFIADNADELVDVATWDKGHAPPQMAAGVMASRYEWMLIFSVKPDASRSVPLSSWRGTVQSVYEGPPQRKNDFASLHAATMPTHLPVWVMQTLCDKARTVYEPFAGTGTTMIAAEQLGRRCYAMEIDPRYVQVAIERWEKFTGRKAERVDG